VYSSLKTQTKKNQERKTAATDKWKSNALRVTVDNFCPDTTGSPEPWSHRCLVVLNEPKEGALSRVWEKITATARLQRVVVVIQDRPGKKCLTRKQYMHHSTNDVTCTELAIFPAGTISFGHAAGWNDYADRNGHSTNSNSASSPHSHTWTCDEDGHIVVPDTHCRGVLQRHDGLLNKRDVRILLLGPQSDTKETLASIQIRDVRKLAFLLGGTNGRSSGNPKDGLCGLAQGRPCDLTGLCRLTIANWISLSHGVKCGGCEIHCHQCLCLWVKLQAGIRK